MKRRSYLSVAGAASITAVAGCIGGSGDRESGAVEGESQSSGAGVELEVQDVTLAHRLTTDEDIEYIPDPGNLFLFLEIESANASDEIVNLANRHELRLLVGDQQFEPLTIDTGFGEFAPTGYKHPWDGAAYETVDDARPNIASSGILAFEIPRDTTEARLTWAREYHQDEPLYWQLSFNPDSVPQFDILDVRVPKTVEYYSEFNVTFEVRNHGAAGFFERKIRVEPSEEHYEISQRIEANETRSLTKSIDYPERHMGVTEQATIKTAFHEATTSFETPTRDAGSFYTGPHGLKITVSDYGLTNYAARESIMSWQDRVEYRPESGHQLLLVEFTVKNTDSVSRKLPQNINTVLQTSSGGEIEMGVKYPKWSGNSDFIEPIRGNVITENEISPGNTMSGWTLYSIPSGVNLDSSYLKWSRGSFVSNKVDYLQARWRL